MADASLSFFACISYGVLLLHTYFPCTHVRVLQPNEKKKLHVEIPTYTAVRRFSDCREEEEIVASKVFDMPLI